MIGETGATAAGFGGAPAMNGAGAMGAASVMTEAGAMGAASVMTEAGAMGAALDRKSTRLNSSHVD